MISESAVCLDRRVVNPPASEADGATTWTLPYPVAVDGSQGRVVVVLLDSELELSVSRPTANTVSAAGSYSGASVAIGVSYTWQFTPSTIYCKGADGQYDRRANVQLSYVRAMLEGTRSLDATITAPDRASCTVQLREQPPTEGQSLAMPVFAKSTKAVLTLSTDSPWPVRIGTLEWDGQFDPVTVTQVP